MFDAPSVDVLRNLLTEKAATPEAAESALNAVLDAIEEYMRDRALVDDEGRRHAISSVAETRRSLDRLIKQLSAAEQALADMPIGAKTALYDQIGRRSLRSKGYLHELAAGAREALSAAGKQDDRQSDTARFVLAYDVAKVFRDVLGVAPTKSRPSNPTVTARKGGALYGRVLAQAMQLAGRGSVNVGPMIDRGIRMLDDPDLP